MKRLSVVVLASAACLAPLAASYGQETSPLDAVAIVRIVAQIPHFDAVTSVAFTRDGRLALTGSRDQTAKLWDMVAGKALRTFQGDNGEGEAVALSPDGRLAISGGGRRPARLWEAATGRVLRYLGERGATDHPTAVAFSPDGRLALAVGRARVSDAPRYVWALYLWEVGSGKRLRSFIGHEEWIKSVAFSPDGRLVLSASDDKTLRLWDAATGRELRRLHDAHDGIRGFAFSPDGRVAVVLCGEYGRTVKLWELATGRELRSFANPETGRSIAVSPDGQSVVAGGSGLSLLHLATGQEVRRFRRREDRGDAIGLAFSPDGRFLYSGSERGNLNVWDVETGKALRSLSGPARQVTSARFSPDGRFVLSGEGQMLRLWDAATGKLLRSFVGYPEEAKGTPLAGNTATVGFSQDGRFAVAAIGNLATLLKRWEIATGKEDRGFVRREPFEVTSFSPDGRYVLIAGRDLGLGAWDMDTGKDARQFAKVAGTIRSMAFSADGRVILTGGEDLQLWDAATGKEMPFRGRGTKRAKGSHDLSDLSNGGRVLALSFDGRLALSGGGGEKVELWDVTTGDLIRSFVGHSAGVTALAFSPDGRAALSGSRDRTLKVWDVATGKELKSFRGHGGDIRSVAFSPDGRLAVSSSDDGSTRLWDVAQGRPLAAMYAAANDEWLTITPHGFFSSSHRDTDMLAIVRGLDVTTVGQVHQSLFNPDLVRESLARDTEGEVERAAKVVNLEKVIDAGPPPAAAVTSHRPGSVSATALVPVSARITDRGKGVGRIEWRVNGVTAGVTRISAGAGPGHDVKRTLALDPGENRVEVIAYEGRNILASPPARTTIVFKGPADAVKPNLHILAVGINAYADKGATPPGDFGHFPPLNLAVADAKAFAAKLQKAGSGQYGEVLVTAALDGDAAAASLDQIVERLSARVNPRDTFVLYAAAHGYSRDGRFYLIPQDYQGGTNPEALATRAISQERLQDWVANRIPARKAVILLDTCESGALVSGYSKARTDAPASEAAIGRLHEATGRPVLTAAASGKPAFEGYRGHGVFTYALMDALHRGDSSGNGVIELSELVAHVQTLVPKLSGELGGRGASMVLLRGLKDDKQSAHFGSTGEDFALVRRLP